MNSSKPRHSRPQEPAQSSSLSGLVQELRYTLRGFRRRPGHTFVTALTLALGIGATTVLVSVTTSVLLKPLPWQEPDRIVKLSETREGGNDRFSGILTNATYRAWSEDLGTLDQIAGYSPDTVTLTGEGQPERVRIAAVTAGLFEIIGAVTQLGRPFDPAEEGDDVIVLTHGLWQERFGGDSGAIGQLLQLDGKPYEVIGVLAPGFEFPDRETRAWIPFEILPVVGKDPNQRSVSLFSALGRLKPGATPEQAAAEGTARGQGGEDLGMVGVAVFGTDGPAAVSAVPLLQSMTGEVRPAILVLLVAAGLLLVTATANVASLQLARATARRRETAVRSALGAGQSRIARQLLVESCAVGLSGGLLGLTLAATMIQTLPAILPADFPRLEAISIDWTVAGFALTLSLVTGIAFGLVPIWQARRLDLTQSLAERGASIAGRQGRLGIARSRALVMAGQVAIACVLLIGAALLGQSFRALLNLDRGYEPSNALTARVNLSDSSYTQERKKQFLIDLRQRLQGLAGVTGFGISDVLPLASGEALMGFNMPPRDGSADLIQAQAMVRNISPGYFSALGIRLREGRDFSESDNLTSRPVIIVNRAFAERYLGPSPLGQEIPVNPTAGMNLPDSAVVGIVDNVRHRGATDSPQPEIYFCFLQRQNGYSSTQAYLVLRSQSDPDLLATTLKTTVNSLDKTLALDSIMTMEDRVWDSLAEPRLYAVLLGGFAFFALMIAGVGLFGVLSYSVAQRTQEMGIRTALGATPFAIVRLVIGQGLAITMLGLVIGLLSTAWLTRLLSSFLFGVSTYDLTSFVGVPLGLLVVSIAACLTPALRAARVDPQRVLRVG